MKPVKVTRNLLYTQLVKIGGMYKSLTVHRHQVIKNCKKVASMSETMITV